MDAVRAVAIGKKEAAVGQEGEIRLHEGIAPPAFRGLGVLVFGVDSRIHWGAFFPDPFALKSELGEILQLLIAGHIEELLTAFGNDFKPMAAALELTAKSADELAR